MRNFLKNRWALSTVVTILIILVCSVLLAGFVTYFAINVVGTRSEEESLFLTKPHVWYSASGQVSEAAIQIVNTGGRDVVITKLTIRGQSVNWESVFYFEGNFMLTSDLEYIPEVSVSVDTPVTDGEGSFEHFIAAPENLALPSGYSMIVYINNPSSININNVGLTVAINVYTSQAMYYRETNVQGQFSESS